MYTFIKGTVVELESSAITLENQGIGYCIYTASPYSFEVGKEYKIYIYEHIREDERSLYGFATKEEKDLFLKLIDVKGLGCKMALPMLATGSINGIIDAIERENILYLKKFPKIGDKVARQIILDLKGKLITTDEENQVESHNEELTEALQALGYKPVDIKKVIPKVSKTLSIEEQIKEALRLLLK